MIERRGEREEDERKGKCERCAGKGQTLFHKPNPVSSR